MGIELTGKNYLKIFFEDDKELYVREEQRYLITKLFNKNDYSTEIDGQILGPPNDNLTLNLKKPYMEHKTRKIMVPYLLTTQKETRKISFNKFSIFQSRNSTFVILANKD